MTLTEFLLARIAEDETNDTTLIGVERKDWTARWMAECAVKRRLVELFGYAQSFDTASQVGWYPATVAIRSLALPYADHPDYRQEWKP